MKTTLAAIILASGALLLPLSGHGADGDTDRSSPKSFVKNTVITSKIKTHLAAEKLSSLARIHVDTDKQGMVVLTGSAENQAAADKAISIAFAVEGVHAVDNRIKIKADK